MPGVYAIVAKNLSKIYGHSAALREVNLALEWGDFVTIFGPNGAGKTTLLKVFSTLIRPTAGSVEINGLGLRDDPNGVRRSIGLISHDSFLYDNLSAYENLRFYGQMFGVEDLGKRIDHLLERVGLSRRRDHPVRTFSKGLEQRLAIARALIHQPRILLLDEPYAGLDLQATEVLDEILAELRDSQHTIIVATHDLVGGLKFCNRVVILRQGRVVLDKERSSIDAERFAEMYLEYAEEDLKWEF